MGLPVGDPYRIRKYIGHTVAPFKLRLHMCFAYTTHCNIANVTQAQTKEHLQATAALNKNDSYDYNKTI